MTTASASRLSVFPQFAFQREVLGTVGGFSISDGFQLPTCNASASVEGVVEGYLRMLTKRPEGATGGEWRIEVPRGAQIEGDLTISVEPFDRLGTPVPGGLAKHLIRVAPGVRTFGGVLVILRGQRVMFDGLTIDINGPKPQDVEVATGSNQSTHCFWGYGNVLVIIVGEAISVEEALERTKLANPLAG